MIQINTINSLRVQFELYMDQSIEIFRETELKHACSKFMDFIFAEPMLWWPLTSLGTPVTYQWVSTPEIIGMSISKLVYYRIVQFVKPELKPFLLNQDKIAIHICRTMFEYLKLDNQKFVFYPRLAGMQGFIFKRFKLLFLYSFTKSACSAVQNVKSYLYINSKK